MYTARQIERQIKFMDENRNPYNDFGDNQNLNYQTFGFDNYQNNNSGYGGYDKKKKSGHSILTVVIASFLAALIGAVGGGLTVKLFDENGSASSSDANGGLNQNITPSNISINVDESVDSVARAVAAKCSQSVVGIRTTTSVQNFFYSQSDEATGEGSGVIYTSDGYIITNYHVISSAVENTKNSRIDVFVGSPDTSPYEAEVIGYSISSDLAVIKIKAEGLTAVEIGDSDKLNIGDYVVTIGSPGGLDFMGSVTYGIVSGLDRIVSTDSDVKLIQTDAAINPGNSGGALLSVEGKLIGINSSKIVSTEYEGMGFSIPVNTVVKKCNKIIKRQNEPEVYVGISFSQRYTESILNYYGYPAGAVVASVDEGSPAYNAGIRRGDIITEFNGKSINSVTLLEELIRESELGSKADIKLYRSGKYYTTEITIGSNN